MIVGGLVLLGIGYAVVKRRARQAGLLTPHASITMGGMGLSHVAKAAVTAPSISSAGKRQPEGSSDRFSISRLET